MDVTFIQDRITATKAQIVALETAAEALLSGGIQSYTIDTGQSRQVVTKFEIRSLQNSIDQLYNRCATLEARLNGGTLHGRPGW